MKPAAVIGSSAVLLLALTACTPTDAAPTPTATSTAEAPLFETEAEALEAAEQAYRDFQAMEDLIASEGGENPDRIRQFAARDLLETNIAEFEQYRNDGLRLEGSITPSDFSLLSSDLTSANGLHVVAVELCLDTSNSRIINASNEDITPPDRSARQGFTVYFDNVESKLKVSTRYFTPESVSC